MVGFPEGHDRLCAIEWLVRRLAVDRCFLEADPLAAAERLKAESEEYGMLLVKHAADSNVTEQAMVAIEISAAISMLVEDIPGDVEGALSLGRSVL